MGGGPGGVEAIKGLFSAARYSRQMGCEFPAIKGSEPADLCALRQEGQLLRADFLDAFARLESAVMLYVEKTSVKATPSMPLSQKLTALARSEEHTSELQSLMRISYAVLCVKKKKKKKKKKGKSRK